MANHKDTIDNGNSNMFQILQKLEELKPTYGNEHFKAALQKDNVDRNRDLNVLAGKYTIILLLVIAYESML